MRVEELFPIADIEASRADRRLQAEHSLGEARGTLGAQLQEAEALTLLRGVSPQGLEWIYFRSPDWTWTKSCGREGWLLWEPQTRKQHAFIATVVN